MKINKAAQYFLLLSVLGGCGGTTQSTTLTGNATMSITWPDQGRLIPVAANSITVAFKNGSTVVATQTVARPTTGNSSTVSFTGIPANTALTLTAAAYPTTTGTGTAQASASQSVTIVAGQTNALSITMDSTINSLAMSPSGLSIDVNGTATVLATALDSSGATVLTSASTLSYASSNPSVASVNASTGLVTGISAGTATITASESESGKTASIGVTVTSVSVGVN